MNSNTDQQLAAILAADAAGYSLLMAEDHGATLTALDAARDVFRTLIEARGGRVVDTAGDSILAVFFSAGSAVDAALQIQSRLNSSAVSDPEKARLRFRIGIHLGDVIHKADGSIYGSGVNVASRLQGLAEPGGIVVSSALHGTVSKRIADRFEDLGERTLKNISLPVRAFQMGRAACVRADDLPVRGWHGLVRSVRVRWRVLSVIVVITGVVVTGAIMAIVQSQRASAAARRQTLVTQFVTDIFRMRSDTSVPLTVGRDAAGDQFLKDGAQLIAQRFGDEPALQAELYGVVAQTFLDMGAYAQAADYASRQDETLRSSNGDKVARAGALLTLARSMVGRGLVVEAESPARQSVELSQSQVVQHANSIAYLINVLIYLNKREEAQRLVGQLDGLTRRLGRETLAEAQLYVIRANLLVNQQQEADHLRERAIAIAQRVEGEQSTTAGYIRLSLAKSLIDHGSAKEAKVFSDRALETFRRHGGAQALRGEIGNARMSVDYFLWGVISHSQALEAVTRAQDLLEKQTVVPASIQAHLNFSRGLLALYFGNIEEAWPLMSASYVVLMETNASTVAEFNLINTLADVAVLSGKHDRADELLKRKSELRSLQGEKEHPFAVYDYEERAVNASWAGRYADAMRILDSTPRFEALSVPGDVAAELRDLVTWARARVLADQGEPEAAWRLVKGLKPHDVADAEYMFSQRALFTELQCAVGVPEATQHLEEIADAMSVDRHPYAPMPAWLRAKAGKCALANGDLKTAQRLSALARTAFARQSQVTPYFKRASLELEEHLGVLAKARLNGAVR